MGRRPRLNPVLTGSVLLCFYFKISSGAGINFFIFSMNLASSSFCNLSRSSVVNLNSSGSSSSYLSFSKIKEKPFFCANDFISSVFAYFSASSLASFSASFSPSDSSSSGSSDSAESSLPSSPSDSESSTSYSPEL